MSAAVVNLTEFERIAKIAKEDVERFIEKVNNPQFIEDMNHSNGIQSVMTICQMFLEMEILQLDQKANQQLFIRLKKTKMLLDATQKLALYREWLTGTEVVVGKPVDHQAQIAQIVKEGREEMAKYRLLAEQCIGPLDPPPGYGDSEEEEGQCNVPWEYPLPRYGKSDNEEEEDGGVVMV